MSYGNGPYHGYNYAYDDNHNHGNSSKKNPQPPSRGNNIPQYQYRQEQFDAPPLPPKPPMADYVRGNTQAVNEFRHSVDVGDVHDYGYNNNNNNNNNYYNNNMSAEPPAQHRRPSQLRGPRQPLANSFGTSPTRKPAPQLQPQSHQHEAPFGYQHQYHYQEQISVPPPPPIQQFQPPAPVTAPVQYPQHYQNNSHQYIPTQHYHNNYAPQKYNQSSPAQQFMEPTYSIDTTHVNTIIEPEQESSSVSSVQSSVQRTTSTNTVYSRASIPEEVKDNAIPTVIHPDRYSGSFVEQPIEVPKTSPRTPYPDDSFVYDDSGDDMDSAGQDASPSFLTDIRDELNSNQHQPIGSPSAYPPHPIPKVLQSPKPAPPHLQLNHESPSSGYGSGHSYSQSPRSPIKSSPSKSLSSGGFGNSPTTPRTPTKRNEVDRYNTASSSNENENKFYNVYNRTSQSYDSTATDGRYSSGNEEYTQQQHRHHQQQTDFPYRTKTMGTPTSSFNRAQLTLPRSSSAKDTLHGVTAESAFNASMRSSSRSTADDTLMKALDLPSIPAARNTFDASRLSTKDYSRCAEPWSLQCIAEWITCFYSDEGDMPFDELPKALVGLFTHHVPTLNWVRAERIAVHAVDSMVHAKFITFRHKEKSDDDVIHNDKMAKLNLQAEVSGVLPILSGNGCYSNRGHHGGGDEELTYRCYSSRCSRTLPVRANMPKVDLQNEESSSDWAAYWNIDQGVVAELERREVKRQYAIHELIVGEEGYVRDLNTLVKVYAESLKRSEPSIMKDQDKFYNDAFSSVYGIIECHSKFMLSSFKYRQTEQGPYVEGVADIVLNWTKHARDAYVQYADTYLLADRRIRHEKECNPAFTEWLERASRDPRTKGIPQSFYFHRAIPRLARYGLLLKAIQKATPESDPEYQVLERAIGECDDLTGECNKRLALVEKTVEIMDLQEQIRFKSNEEAVDLKLRDGKRRVHRRGDVLRRGDYRMDWISTHLMLFDNYLVLSKVRKVPSGTTHYVTKRVSYNFFNEH